MTTEATRVAIEDMIDAFERGDHERLAARYADDIEWRFHAPDDIFPFPAERRGKFDVLTALVEIYRDYEILSYKVTTLTVEGDRAATMSDIRLRQRSTGQLIVARVGGFHRFSDGQLVAYDGYADYYSAAEQPRGGGVALQV